MINFNTHLIYFVTNLDTICDKNNDNNHLFFSNYRFYTSDLQVNNNLPHSSDELRDPLTVSPGSCA